MKSQLIALILMLSLTGCSQVSSNDICPPVAEYTKAKQVKAANELKGCVKCPDVDDMMIDYGVARDQSRVCQ